MPKLAKQIEDQLLKENPEFRAQGLRPAIIWVYDPESPGFDDELRREIESINNSPDHEEVLTLLDRAAEDLFSD
jgi:hypothetical protein